MATRCTGICSASHDRCFELTRFVLTEWANWRIKGKEGYLYSAFLHQGRHKALRHGSHSFTCKQHHACLSFVSVHQMAAPQELRQQTYNCNLLLIYRPRKHERLSWPGWLTCSGWFTHLSGLPSATGRAQNSERTPAKDRRYTVGPRNQLLSTLSNAFRPQPRAKGQGQCTGQFWSYSTLKVWANTIAQNFEQRVTTRTHQ